jgi:hypothetical protein
VIEKEGKIRGYLIKITPRSLSFDYYRKPFLLLGRASLSADTILYTYRTCRSHKCPGVGTGSLGYPNGVRIPFNLTDNHRAIRSPRRPHCNTTAPPRRRRNLKDHYCQSSNRFAFSPLDLRL